MKKIGLICLALVVALGALGTGYAMWYDTVTISGQVHTGSVDIEILSASFDRIYKDLTTDELVYVHHAGRQPGEPPPAYADPTLFLLVGETTAEVIDGNTMVVSYNNIFPIPNSGWHNAGYWFTDWTLHCNGSVPVKLEMDVVVDGIPEEWVVVITDSVVPFPPGQPLEGIQLEYCQTLSCGIGICIPDGPDNPNVGMNLNGTITVTVKGVQWNEYTPPPTPSPTP